MTLWMTSKKLCCLRWMVCYFTMTVVKVSKCSVVSILQLTLFLIYDVLVIVDPVMCIRSAQKTTIYENTEINQKQSPLDYKTCEHNTHVVHCFYSELLKALQTNRNQMKSKQANANVVIFSTYLSHIPFPYQIVNNSTEYHNMLFR